MAVATPAPTDSPQDPTRPAFESYLAQAGLDQKEHQFAAVDWCAWKATISGSTFSIDTAESPLTSCARTLSRKDLTHRPVDAGFTRARSARVGAMSLDASDAIEDGDARVSCESAQWKDDVVHLLELERRTMDAILNSGPTFLM